MCLVSVIIPVYNTEKYLSKAVNSILKQTLEQELLEILLIDDGSKDRSSEICDHYATKYQNIRVFHQDNAGVSAARNKGIREAKGKYIAYLDADDWISPDTLKMVLSFFELHYHEIDLVSYPILHCYTGKRKAKMLRDKLIGQTGIVDVRENSYLNLTTMNLVVKNVGNNNILFDETLKIHEDIDYQIRIITRTGCFGFVKEAQYYYRRSTGESATDFYADSANGFLPAIRVYEKWLSSYGKNSTMMPYVQSSVVKSLSWKLREGILFPKHLNEEAYAEGLNKFRNIVYQIEDEILLGHPELDYRDRFFLLSIKDSYREPRMENQSDNATVFLTHMKRERGILTVAGMLTGIDSEINDITLMLSTPSEVKQMPLALRKYSWSKSLGVKWQKDYIGFYENIPWDYRGAVQFRAYRHGTQIPLRCCYGPDVCKMEQAFKKNNIKLTLFDTGVRFLRLFYSHVQLYYNGTRDSVEEKRARSGHSYHIMSNREQAPNSYNKQDLQFGSKKHRLLFLAAETIVLRSPEDQFIPFYEKSYERMKECICHQLIVRNI